MAPDVSIWDTEWAIEEHMQAFAEALEAEDEAQTEAPNSPVVTTRSHHFERTQRISAVSDFAPINTRVKRKKRGHPSQGKQGVWYHILRWPLLVIIFLVIFAEFGFYVFIRQCVNTLEWLLGRGRKGRLRTKLRQSRTYDEWKETAKELDEYMGFDEWKKEPEDPFYDYVLVRKVLRSLRAMRDSNDAHGLVGVLEVCIRANFAGTETQRLYSETYYKTKDLIEAYVTEVERALAYIRETPQLSIEEKRRFFKSTNTNLGASALCLSGGASFGYYHFGVVRAFLDAKMMPRVITGTSAGGLIAALICTHTDEELRELLVPALADKITACEDPFSVWFRRFWKTGARFDTVMWARKSAFFTRGSLTFREAYELTGRVLNISVTPSSRYSPTKLLNHLTSPDCVIWSAIIASAAVPGILNPVVLMQKTKNGHILPWNWGSRFKDGSLRVDIPLQSLNLLFNVNYPIVSQVNPHVHLFNFSPRGSAGKPVAHRRGKGWRGGFVLSAAEQYLKLELTKNFKVIRDLELMPQLLGQDWSSVFLQRFDGAVTIWPRSRVRDWFRLLTDPDRDELARMMHVGQIVSFPKLHMIENRYRLEREIYRGRLAVRQELQARERDRVAPDTDQGAGADVDTAGAGPSNGKQPTNGRSKLSKAPWPSATSSQLPIESEAEASFNSRDRRLKKSNDGAASPGTARRRHNHIREESGNMDEGAATTPINRHPHLEVPDHQHRPPSPATNGAGPSFMTRLRTRSFPVITNLPNPFQRSIGPSSSKGKSRPPLPMEDDRWSSDTETDDDVPWTGALMTPRLGSRISLAGSGSGLGLTNGVSREVNPMEDEFDEDSGTASDSGHPAHAAGVDAGLEEEAREELEQPHQDDV